MGSLNLLVPGAAPLARRSPHGLSIRGRYRRPDPVAAVSALGDEGDVVLNLHHRPGVAVEVDDVEPLEHGVDRGAGQAEVAQVRPRQAAAALLEQLAR